MMKRGAEPTERAIAADSGLYSIAGYTVAARTVEYVFVDFRKLQKVDDRGKGLRRRKSRQQARQARRLEAASGISLARRYRTERGAHPRKAAGQEWKGEPSSASSRALPLRD